MAVTAAELIILVRAEGVAETASALAGLSASADGAALGLGALAIAGAATIGALGASVAAASSFQTTLQNVQNNTTMTTADLGVMRDAVLQLGAATGAPLDNLATGFMKAMNITNDTAASMDILKIATESAVSTGGNAVDTTSILANAMHEYGADVSTAATAQERQNEVLANATRYMNVFHLSAAEGNMTLSDFAASSGKSIGIAANLGVSVEDVSAAFATLTKHGFDAAQSGTQVTDMLTHMINPTKAQRTELEKLSQATGVNLVADFSAAGLHGKGLAGVLGDVKEAYVKMGLSEAQAEQESMKLINAQRGGLGMAVLLGTGAEDYKNILADLTNQQKIASVTQDAFNRSQETAGFQWNRMKVQFQELGIALGAATLPALTQILTAINLIIPALIKFTEAHAGVIAAVMAAAGSFAVLVAAHALLAPSIAVVVEALGAVVAALTGPFALALLAGGLLVRAYATNWHGFGTAVNGAVDVTKAALAGLIAAFRTGDFNAAFGTIITAVDKAFGAGAAGKVTLFVSTALRGLQLFRDTVITVTEALRGEWVPSAAIQPFVNAVGIATTKARELAEAASTLLAPALAFLREHFLAISTVVGVAISALMGMPLALLAVWTGVKLLAVAWAEDFHGIREITATVAAAIGTVLATLGGTFSTLGTAVRGALDAAGAQLSAFGATIRDALGTAVTVAVSAVGATFSTLGTTVSGALSTVGGAFSAFGTTIHNSTAAIRDLASTIGAGLHGALTALAGILGTVGAAFGATSGSATAIGAAFQAIGTAARTSVTALGEVATALANIVRQGVGGYFTLLGMAIQPLLPLLGQLAQFLGGVLVVAIGVGMGAIGGLAGFLTNTLAGALRIVTGTLEIVSGGIQIFAAILTGVINVVTDLIHGNWTAAWHDAGTALSKAFDGMKMQVLGLADVLLGAFQTMFGSILGAVGGFGATVVGYFADVYQKTTEHTAPWAAGMIASFQNLSTQSIGSTQQMHDQLVHLLDIGPQVSASTAAIGSGANEMVGPMNSATGATGSFTDRLRALLTGTSAAPASFGNLSGGVKALASSMDAGAAAANAYDKAIQSLGSTGGQLKGYLATLQAQWDALNVATANGTNVNAQQAASFAQLAGPIQYINAQLGINQQQTTAATLAAVNHMQATNGAAAADNTAANAALGHGLALGAQAAAAVAAAGATAASGVAAQMASGQVSNLTTTINAIPKAATTAVTAPGATEATGQVNAVTAAVATVPKSFTVTAVVDTSGALAAIADLDAHMPHSPARTGPFSTLPNWNALFSALPAAFNSAGAAFDAFGATVGPKFANAGRMAVQGLTNGMNALGASAADAATGMASGVNDAVVNFFEIASPSKKTHAHGQAVAQGLTNGIASATPAAAKAAADLAVAVSKGITDTLAAMHLLSTYDFATGSPTGGQFAMLGTLTAQMVATIQDAAKGFGDAGLKAATTFADAASKVGGMVKGALDGLSALAAYDFAKATPTGQQMGMLTTLVTALVQSIQDAAVRFDAEGLKAASTFSDAASKVGGMVKNALAGLHDLATFDFATGTPTADQMGVFAKSVTNVVQSIQDAAVGFTGPGLAAATAFSDAASKALGIIKTGVDGLTALATFTAPSAAAVDAFAVAVRELVAKFAVAAASIGTDGVTAATAFGTAANTAVNTIKTGIDAFKAFKDMVIPSAAAIDTLVAGVTYVVAKFRDMADQMGGDALRKAQAFGTAVENTAKSIQTAIGTFKSLTEPPFKGAMTKIMTEFNGDFDGSLAMMIEAHGKAAQFETEARMYKEAMLNAATSIAAGNAALANAALPGNSLGRDMKTAGANLGDSLATGVRDALQIKSPSQVMVAVGQQVVAGLVGGMSSTQQDAVKKAAELAKAVADAVIATLTSLRALGNLNSAALPSGDQVGGFLGSTMQVVNAVATAASAMNGKALDAAVKFAEGAGKVLGFVGSGVDALAKLATAVLPSTAAIYGLGKLIQATVNDFAVMAEAVGTEMLGSAVDFAAGAGAVAEAVGKAVDGLTKLAGYVDPAPAAIYALGKTLRLAIQDFAALAALVGKDMLAEAGALADGAGKVADTVGKGVAGLGKLVDYVDPPAAAVYALGKTIRLMVADFAAIADLLGNDASASAGRFADSAGKVVGIIGNAVDGFTKLADYKGIANGLIGPFVESVRTLVAAIGQAAAQFTTEGLTLAGQFADAASKSVGILSNGVDGFTKLATYKGVGDAAIGAFVATVTTLVRGIGAASVAFTSDGLKLSGAFADAASKAVGILGAGVTGFASLATFVGPTQATMDAFLATVRYTVARFGEMATILDADGTKATTAFADAAAKSLGAVGAGVTAFKDMATLVLPVPATIDDLVNTIRYAVGQVAAAAKLFGGDTLAAATAFGTAASGVFAALKSGLDLFTALGKLNAPLTTAWLQPLVDLMGGVLTRSATLVTQAQQLKSDADRFAATIGQAFAGFTNAGGGLGAFGGGLALGSPVPLAAANGGGGGGGGGGTTNVYVTITGNTMLADDPATADALARLLKPRLAQVGGY